MKSRMLPLHSVFIPACVVFCVAMSQHGAAQGTSGRAGRGDEAAAVKFTRERFAIKHRKYVLENGLTLLVHEDRSAPIVAVNVWYHVGSRNERRGRTGFAHLFEHFFFNGSENYPHGFREAMDDLGVNNRNGTTNPDRTNFYEDVPLSGLERTLYLEADRMGFLAGHISQEMLERERGVVQNEKRQNENQPYGKVFGEILSAIYPYSHPYSWTTIGSMEDLEAASLEDIREWYKTYYGPNNAVISLAGDISPERALELVQKYFGNIPPGPPLARMGQWVPELERNMRSEMEDRVPQARIYRVYHAPPWSDPELQHLDLMMNILSGSKSARLDKRLIYEKELATGVFAYVDEGEIASTLIVSATVKPGGDPAAVEREMDAVIDELIAKGPTAEELQRAQSRILADFVRGTERLGSRANVLSESMTYGGDSESYLNRLERTANARGGEIAATARRWMNAHHFTMLVKPFPRFAAGKSEVDRKILPELGAASDVNFPKVQRAALKNGLSVVLLERHSTPLVNLTLAVDAGHSADPSGKAGAATLVMSLLDEGTRKRNAFQMVDELDALGAQIRTGSSQDFSFVRLRTMPANLGPSLEVFADVVQNPAFPQEMFVVQKRRRLAQIEQEKAQPANAALRVLPSLLYGPGHAYGNPWGGSGHEKSVASLTRDDLVAWHAEWFRPDNATIIVAGDITMDQLLPLLERAFAGWRGQGRPPVKNVGSVARTAGGRVYLMDKPDATQSVIVAAHVSEPNGQAEELAIETVMRNFGGIATSRLNRNLRLDKHWSYGTSGFLTGARGPRSFVVIAPVQTDKTKEAMAEVAKEIRGVAGDRPLAGDEYASIMRNMTMRLPGRFETLDALEDAAVDMINYRLPEDYWARYAGSVRALTEDQLGAAAKKFVHPGEIIWIVVGDLAKMEKGVRELGYGEVIRLDRNGEPVQ